MKICNVISALALAAIGLSPAAAAPLVPTGKWVVNFADERCEASRNYGSKERPVFLVFKPAPMGNVMQIAVISHRKSGETLQVPATLIIDQRPVIRASMLAYTLKAQERRINMINLPLETFAPVREASTVTMRAHGEVSETFALSQMKPLMASIDTCAADLREAWNIGEERSGRIKESAKPKKPLGSYFSSQDYPEQAIMSGQGGTLEFAMLIDEKGKLADCTVISTSGVASLDSQSCAALVARASFTPAIGMDGKAIKSAITQRIRWEIPE